MSYKILKILNGCKNLGLIASTGVLCLGIGTSVRASVITPGQTLPTNGTAVYGGTLLIDTGPQAFTGIEYPNIVSFTGELDSKVYSDPANEFAPGDLDFVYQFTDDANANNDPIQYFSIASFSGFATDADFVAGSGTGTNLPTKVSRDPADNGDTLTFQFPLASAVAPGTTSVQLVIDTNASAFTLGLASLQDGGNISLPAPAPEAVPEPATAAIAGFALCALGLRRRNANRA